MHVPNGIAELTTIGTAAKLVYGRLCQFAGSRGYCWPAISTLSCAIGVTRTTTKKAIKELVAEKLIEVVGRINEDGDATSNLYYFLDHPVLNTAPLMEDGQGRPESGLPQKQPDLGQNLPSKRIKEENHKKTTTSAVSSSHQGTEIENQVREKENMINTLRHPELYSRCWKGFEQDLAKDADQYGDQVYLIADMIDFQKYYEKPSSVRTNSPLGLLRKHLRGQLPGGYSPWPGYVADWREQLAMRLQKTMIVENVPIDCQQSDEIEVQNRKGSVLAKFWELPDDIQRNLESEAELAVVNGADPVWELTFVVERYISMQDCLHLQT